VIVDADDDNDMVVVEKAVDVAVIKIMYHITTSKNDINCKITATNWKLSVKKFSTLVGSITGLSRSPNHAQHWPRCGVSLPSSLQTFHIHVGLFK